MKQKPHEKPLLDAGVTSDGKLTLARVHIANSRFEVKVEEKAIRDVEDTNRPEIGEMLALGRALDVAGRKLRRKAEGLVKHYDDLKIHKAQIEVRRANGDEGIQTAEGS